MFAVTSLYIKGFSPAKSEYQTGKFQYQIFSRYIKEVPFFSALETVGATLYPKVNEDIHVAIVPFAGHLVHADQPEIYTRILEEFIKCSC